MKQLKLIAVAEWQYWLRTQVLLGGVALFAIMLISISVFTALRMDAESHGRAHQQQTAEATFLEQPDRHPHRMVHYGHYVFRHPVPLALFDPGLDSVTGQSVFLEGHRQNSAMFSEAGASADFAGLSWLTPALMYQLFAPLLIIVFGHGSIAREREARVLGPLIAQGVDAGVIIFGKLLALLSFVVLLLTPLLASGLIALVKGASVLSVFALVTVYCVYLAVWAVITLCVSALFTSRSEVLATLSALWLGITLVLPSIMVDLAIQRAPLAGKIEADLIMLGDLRKLGDGHNAKDPAFTQLRANFLKEHNVSRVEDLPINFRGVVAKSSEQKLTEVMNRYAAMRMEGETNQAKHLSQHAWLTPTLAIAEASRTIAGTDLSHYHRFLQEAEGLRFDFVQGLNDAHINKLSYQDDVNRNNDDASSKRARVDATTWAVLDTFLFEPAPTSVRLVRSVSSMAILVAWLAAALLALFWSVRRLTL